MYVREGGTGEVQEAGALCLWAKAITRVVAGCLFQPQPHLAGTPDMAQKLPMPGCKPCSRCGHNHQVPFPFRSQRQLRRSVGAREENEAYDVLRCHLRSGKRTHRGEG
eukprot:5370513-Prymnesium_polylepis.4